MKFEELLKMVFINIWANKFRAFLTMLGIIVGTATIILVVAVGKGGQAEVKEQFARLNVGTLYVMSAQGQSVKTKLNPDDAQAIMERAPSVSLASPSISGKAQIGYQDVSYQGGVSGVLPDYQLLTNLEVREGRFIDGEDDTKRNRVAVIGSDLAEILFEGETDSVIGKVINVNKRRFEVIGILERLGDSMGGDTSIDESILVPYTVAEKYVLGSNVRPRIIVLAKDINSVPAAMREIAGIIRETHRLKGADDFMIRDAGSRLSAAQDSAKTMSVLLIAVAVIVLIVGGIGIMNVMFVSVNERTREIGILKAIGTRRKYILLQFLLEAVSISLIGGLIGTVLGIFAVPLLKYLDIAAIPSFSGISLGLLFSAFTGTFFGYNPAKKASHLSPLEALRYE
ncbi:MAG: ABC-type antimicrobial peptide transport system, permease component [Firmicutes bacterium]|nr:ABC-type antimicrobial peptide transport system, permease component [Bacillota bacterium]MDI6705655.1 ABC transporter permease [Bacillota bacterium]